MNKIHNNELNINKIMRQVIYALVLGVVVTYYFFGWGIVLQIALAIVSAIVVESVFLKLRGYPVKHTVKDGSAVLTAILLAISVPSIAPWWIIVVGTSFAIIFGKQLYGGLGNNPFNPAMLGYAFLLISYPLQMTTWQTDFLSFYQTFDIIFNLASVDAISGATKLDEIRTALSSNNTVQELSLHLLSQTWINAGFLCGGLYLLWRGIIVWQIPTAFLAGIIVSAVLIEIGSTNEYLSLQNHLTLGATMLGAFFIATDPVSSSTTPNGRIIYGFLIGVLIVIIRTFGNYPDGVAFAVLLMNMLVPLIDSYTRPKVFGQ